jgi:type II pantothenate kinase
MSGSHSRKPAGATFAGADVGTSLIKLAVREAPGRERYHRLPAGDLDAAAAHLIASRPSRVGLTGGGAPRLARLLHSDTAEIAEFDAWGHGARAMLAAEASAPERFLLVSLGTGTSALLVEPGGVRRVGGTALGGGTLAGLGRVLVGTGRFEELAALAREGDRRRVDLLISDVYPEGRFQLPPDINAASFARLARLGEAESAQPADLAHALMGLVGENVALICAGLAAALQVERIVFGGSPLRDNAALVEVLRLVCLALSRHPIFLPQGEFAGALGALESVAADVAPVSDPAARG